MFSLTAQLQLRAPNNVNQVLRQVQNQLQGVNVPLTITGQAQVQRGLTRTNAAVNDLNRSSGRLTRSFAVLTRRFAAFSIATRAISLLTNKLSSAVDEAIAFEREINKISQVTGKTAGQLKSLTNEIANLSTTLGVSSNQLATVGRVLSQAGFKANDLSVALKALAKTSLAPTFDDITKTAEGAIAVFNQFGQGAAALEGQLGAINAVAGKFAVESSDLIGAVSRVGGVFASAGGNLNELIGLFTSVRSTTRESAESIATGLRTILTRIQRPATIGYLEQLGVSLTKLDGSFVGPFEAIKRMNAALGDIPAGDLRFVKIAEQLGGFRQIGKVIPLLQNFTVAEEARQVALNGGASLTKDAATAQKSLAVQISKVKEEYLALVRGFADSSTFRVLVKSSLALASSLASVLSTLKPLLPLITAFATVKLGGALVGALGPRIAGARRGPIGLASGGVVPGSGSGDTVPAMLTPGEFVIKKSSVGKIGTGALHSMNAQKFAFGGNVGAISLNPIGESIKSSGTVTVGDIEKSLVNNNQLPGNTKGNKAVFNKDSKRAAPARKIIREELGVSGNSKSIKGFAEGFPTNKVDSALSDDIPKFLGTLIDKAGKELAKSVQGIEPLSGPINKSIIDSIGISDIKGKIFEGALNRLGAPLVADSSNERDSFDFSEGLGSGLNGVFKSLGKFPVDAKRSIDKPKLEKEIIGRKAVNHIAGLVNKDVNFQNLKGKGFNSGGLVQKFEAGGGVQERKKSAYVFDFDDTIGVSAGKANNLDPSLVKNAAATRYASLAKRRASQGDDIHVLTARFGTPGIKEALAGFMNRIGAPAKSVITTANMLGNKEFEPFLKEREPGKRPGTTRKIGTAGLKAKVLERLAAQYESITFLDDNDENILKASKVPGVKAVKADQNKLFKKNKRAMGGLIQMFKEGGPVGIFDSDYIAGGTKDKNAILESVLGKNVVSAIWGAAGSGKSTYTRAQYGDGLIGSLEDVANYNDFAVISGAGPTKAGGFSPAAAKVFSKAAKIIALLPDDSELDKRRGNRVKYADNVIKGGDKRSVEQLEAVSKFAPNTSKLEPLIADLKKFGKPLEIIRRATGGGIGGTDTVPAMLTPGEFVINKQAASRIGGSRLNRMNKSGVTGFASGGEVGKVQKFGDGGGVLGGGLTSLAIIGPAVAAALSQFGDKSEEASAGMAATTIALEKLASSVTLIVGTFGYALPKILSGLKSWTEGLKESRKETLEKVDKIAGRVEKRKTTSETAAKAAKKELALKKSLESKNARDSEAKRVLGNTSNRFQSKEFLANQKVNDLKTIRGATGDFTLTPKVKAAEEELAKIRSRQSKIANRLAVVSDRLSTNQARLTSNTNRLKKAQDASTNASEQLLRAELKLGRIRKKTGGLGGKIGRGAKTLGANLLGKTAIAGAVVSAGAQLVNSIASGYSEFSAREAQTASKRGDVAGVARNTENAGLADLFAKQFSLSGIIENIFTEGSIQKGLDRVQDQKVEAAVGTASTSIGKATTDFSTAGDEADIGKLTSTVGAKVSAGLKAIEGDGSTVDIPGIGKIGGGSVSKEQREQGLRELQKAGSAAAVEIGKAAKSPAELKKAINDLVGDSSLAGKKLKEEFTKVAESAAAVAAASKLQVEAELDRTKITSAFGRAQTAAENFALSAQTGASSLQIASNTINSSLSTIGDPSQGREAIDSARSTTEQFLQSRGLAGTTTAKSIGRSFDTASAANELGSNLQSAFAEIKALPANEAEKTAKTKARLQAAADQTGNEDVKTAVAGKIQQLFGSGSGPDNKGPELDKVMKALTGTMTELGATSKAVIDAQIKHENDIRKLTEQRRKSEEALIQAQSKAIDIQLEAGKIIENAGGRRLTSGDRTSARTAQFNLRARDAGISGLRGGSASDIRSLGSKISESFDKTQRKRLEGITNKQPLSVDDDNRDELKAASAELIKFSKQRINILKDELTVATKKLSLEKSSVEALLAGDAEGFFNKQGQAAASSALRTGDSTLLRSLGGADIAGGIKSLQETLSPQELQKALTQSGALQGIGLGKREAQLLSGTTNEQEAINSQIREIAGAMAEISNVGANLENMSVTAAQVMITGTKIVFDNKLSQEVQNQNNIDKTPQPAAPINNIATTSKLDLNGNVTITVNGMNDQLKGSFEDFARKFIANQIGNFKVGPNNTIVASTSIVGQ